MAFVTDKEELKPGLIIFRRGDVEHRMWYRRLKIPKVDRYKTVSLKTTEIEIARERAFVQDANLLLRLKYDIPVFTPPFREVGRNYLLTQEARARRGEISTARPGKLRAIIEGILDRYALQHRADLQAAGQQLKAAQEPDVAPAAFSARSRQGKSGTSSPRSTKVWPDYARSLAGAPPNLQGTGSDRSMADFSWCMTAIDWGWSIEDTVAKLPEVSEKARERIRLKDDGYPLITAQNAAVAVERNAHKRGRG